MALILTGDRAGWQSRIGTTLSHVVSTQTRHLYFSFLSDVPFLYSKAVSGCLTTIHILTPLSSAHHNLVVDITSPEVTFPF